MTVDTGGFDQRPAAVGVYGSNGVVAGRAAYTGMHRFGELDGIHIPLLPDCGHTAVAAETPYQAWDAVKAIKVKYEILPFVVDERKAVESGTPAVHEGGNRSGETQTYERGNVEKGFAEADVVLEGMAEQYEAS